MKTIIRAALIAVPFMFAACTDQQGEVKDGAADVNKNTLEEAQAMNDNKEGMENKCSGFVTEAGQSGMREVEMGTAASAKAYSQEVKTYAQQIVADHSKANNELKELAAKKNITLPNQQPESSKADHDKMMAAKDLDFDKAFMQMMVNDHKRSVELFEDASKDCEDAELKAFASKHLPILQRHLETAELMSEALKKKENGGYTKKVDSN